MYDKYIKLVMSDKFESAYFKNMMVLYINLIFLLWVLNSEIFKTDLKLKIKN